MGRKNSGFTLVELIIVVSIIAALALTAIAYFRGQLFKGNDAKRKGDINRIKIAVEEYEKDHNCYPLTVSCSPGTGLKPYLDKVPCDPTTKASYYYEHQDSICPGWYRVYTNLDNDSDPSIVNGIGPNAAFNFEESSANAPVIAGTVNESTPPPSGGGDGQMHDNFYGCKSGVCTLISWDSSRPGPECDPNYQNSNCYGQCGQQINECVSWK